MSVPSKRRVVHWFKAKTSRLGVKLICNLPALFHFIWGASVLCGWVYKTKAKNPGMVLKHILL